MNRVTKERVLSLIVDETYTVLPSGKVIVCELTLENGFTVRGESAVVDKANFDPIKGMELSKERAIWQIWQLEGYLLQEKLFREKK